MKTYTKVFNKKLGRWVWKIDVTIAGQRIRRAEFPSKREAEEAVARLKTTAREQRYGLVSAPASLTVGELCAERLKDPQIAASNVAPIAVERFKTFIGEDQLVISLGRSGLKGWQLDLESDGLRNNTINRYLSVVRAMLNAAGDYFPELEDWNAPPTPKAKRQENRSRVLDLHELSAILKSLGQIERYPRETQTGIKARLDFFDTARMMLLTCGRRSDVWLVTKRDVNRRWKTLVMHSAKTNKEWKIPLTESMLTVLDDRICEHSYFQSYEEKAIAKILARVGKAAGVEYGQQIPGGWTLHDFRRTAASEIENAGIPYSAVATLLSHERQDMSAIYTPAHMEQLSRAVKYLENWCRQIDGFFPTMSHQPAATELIQNA